MVYSPAPPTHGNPVGFSFPDLSDTRKKLTMTTPQSIEERIDALNPDTTDWNDAATYAALGIGGDDDGQGSGVQDQGDTAQAPAEAPAPAPAAATPAPAPAPAESSQAPAAAPAPNEPVRVEGIATVDGKRVIPYAVLQNTRQEARHLREENSRLQQELEAARSKAAGDGNQALVDRAASAPETLTEAELAELEQDYPALSKAMKILSATQAQVQKLASAPTPAPAPAAAAPAPSAEQSDEEFDHAIAASPLISKWMSEKGPEWDRAVALDDVLRNDPRTADLTFAERFARVERMVAAEFDIPLPSKTPPTPAPAAAPAAPAPAAAATPAAPPPPKAAARPTLTDLGGTPPASADDAINSKTALDLLAATEGMSEEQLMRMAGVIY